MGYRTQVMGKLEISPPIPWGEIAGSPFLPFERNPDHRDVVFRVEEITEETHDGTLTRRTAVAVEPCTDDEFKAYHFDEHLQELVTAHGHERAFSGVFEGHGEEQGDIWRVRVSSEGRVERIVPEMQWPDWPT